MKQDEEDIVTVTVRECELQQKKAADTPILGDRTSTERNTFFTNRTVINNTNPTKRNPPSKVITPLKDLNVLYPHLKEFTARPKLNFYYKKCCFVLLPGRLSSKHTDAEHGGSLHCHPDTTNNTYSQINHTP